MRSPEEVSRAFQDAWNGHDMNALGALFEDDATFVNRFGHLVRGVYEIKELHRPIHETIYSDSMLQNDICDISLLSGEVAVVHLWSRLSTGTAHPAGPHDVDTIILAVLVKKENAWRIKALENVTLTDPRSGKPILRDAHLNSTAD